MTQVVRRLYSASPYFSKLGHGREALGLPALALRDRQGLVAKTLSDAQVDPRTRCRNRFHAETNQTIRGLFLNERPWHQIVGTEAWRNVSVLKYAHFKIP